MQATRRFPRDILAAVQDGMVLGIRAGAQPHRFIGIWAVVVEGRVFVRSWSLKPRSWYRTFVRDPRGAVHVAGREMPIRAIRTRSERLKEAVSRAYLETYDTPGSVKYARDLGRAKSRETTTELVPLSTSRAETRTPGSASSGPPRRAGGAKARTRPARDGGTRSPRSSQLASRATSRSATCSRSG